MGQSAERGVGATPNMAGSDVGTVVVTPWVEIQGSSDDLKTLDEVRRPLHSGPVDARGGSGFGDWIPNT